VETTKYQVLAKTLAGLEEVFADELAELGVENLSLSNRAVTFEADNALLYRLNLWSRLALRFFRHISTFEISKTSDLYDGVAAHPWWKWIGVDQTFRIDNTVYSDLFNNPLYASQLSKDAIVDQFRKRFNTRPSVDKENPDFIILLVIRGKVCSLYYDSTGEALFKRGYRIKAVAAPINEVLAAGIVRLSKWNPSIPLIDPMCGSGTIPIEAALMAMNIPPGANRQSYAFMKWPDFDRFLWRRIQEEVFSQQRDQEMEIFGYDISSANLAIARENIRQMHLHKDISLTQADFLQLKPPVPEGYIIINPPYGQRLKTENLLPLYKGIGDNLKKNFSGYKAWIISSDLDALKAISLKPQSKFTLYNGQLECRLNGYELFRGDWNKRFEENNISI
jgi:putative N6-adenine-specific DNA methylase